MLNTTDHGTQLNVSGYSRATNDDAFATYRLNTGGTFTAYGYSRGERHILGKDFKTAAQAKAAIKEWKPKPAQAIKREIGVLNGKPVDVCRRWGGVPYSPVYTDKRGLPKPSPWANDPNVDWHLIATDGTDPIWQTVLSKRHSVLPGSESHSTKGKRYDASEVMATIGPDVTAKDLQLKFGMHHKTASRFIKRWQEAA